LRNSNEEQFSRFARNDKSQRTRERGYALLMVCFLAALMVIATAAAVPSILTEGRRAKEAEMIWRGEQYARAVRLYYRKNGRFPQSFEQLTEPKGQIRFLRKAYADPMNRKDGSWRLIYVGPNGELIGSVKSINIFGRPGGGAPGGPNPFGQPPRPGSDQRSPDVPSSTPPSVAKSPEPEGRVFGGNIIGVASKMPQSSIRVYKGATIYREWEFMWDPAADGMIIGPAGSRPAVPPGKAPPAGTTRPRQ
jgi:type II secretory pathway pseudopilin PulG